MRVAGRVLDVHVTRAGGAVQTGIVKEARAEPPLAVIRAATRVGDALSDQVLAHRVALHVAARLTRRNPQSLQRRRLSFTRQQLVRAAPDGAADVPPRERPSRVRGAGLDRLLLRGCLARHSCRRDAESHDAGGVALGCVTPAGCPRRSSSAVAAPALDAPLRVAARSAIRPAMY